MTGRREQLEEKDRQICRQTDRQTDRQPENKGGLREPEKTVGEPVGGTQSDRQRG